jgi:hypothetical protein
VDPTVLDTDVASLLHRGTLAGPLATRLTGREPLITFVTFGELAKWAEIRNWGQRRREELTSWLSRIAVLPGDEAAHRPARPPGIDLLVIRNRRRALQGGPACEDASQVAHLGLQIYGYPGGGRCNLTLPGDQLKALPDGLIFAAVRRW